jgi:hypothetical protein
MDELAFILGLDAVRAALLASIFGSLLWMIIVWRRRVVELDDCCSPTTD